MLKGGDEINVLYNCKLLILYIVQLQSFALHPAGVFQLLKCLHRSLRVIRFIDLVSLQTTIFRRFKDFQLVWQLISSKSAIFLKSKGKVFLYSLPRVGPDRADPGVQVVSPQVTKPFTRQ